MSEATDLVDVVIDDVQLSVPKGTLVIRAAEQAGIRIPRFCDHPLLKPAAACRQCLVEVGMPDRRTGELRFMPKPQPSCAQTVTPGMVVKTQHTSEVARVAQHGIMEFLLINHPLDCPICDKGGECPLQNQAMTEGRGKSRFADAKRTYPKPLRLTSQIMLDRDRCILCQRCVRFGKEIAGDAFIDLQGRGGGTAPTDDHYFMPEQIGSFDTQVLNFHDVSADGPRPTMLSGPYGEAGLIGSMDPGDLPESGRDQSGRAFASYFSGNIIQICPVGALTASSYRFRSRPFDIVSTASVTEHDASGSALRIDVRHGEVVRRMAGNDPEVNEEWITDKDRFAFEWDQQSRLTQPLVREDGKLVATSWSDALDRARRGLQAAREQGTVGLLPGGRLTFEDAWAWSKFARTVLHTDSVDARARSQSQEELGFLATRVAGTGLGVTYSELETAGQVLLVALEPEDECGSIFLRLRKGVLAGGVKVASIAPFTTAGSHKMGAEVLHAAPGTEVEVLAALAAGGAHEDLFTRLAGGVILVGERAARTPGLLSAVSALADRAGARLQWVPRRAGERGAVEAGLLPGVLPFGRPLVDAAARDSLGWGDLPTEPGLSAEDLLSAGVEGSLAALVTGGVDVRDADDPARLLTAVERAGFVVALEVRASELTEMADVVLPVAPPLEKNGTFLNWEGRLRPFGQAVSARSLTDRDVLVRLAREFGVDLGVETLTALYDEVNPLMSWSGARVVPTDTRPPSPPAVAAGQAVLATHKPMLDAGRLQDGAPWLAGSARRPVALVSGATLASVGIDEGDHLRLSTDRGSLTLPVEVSDLPDNVVWVPECSQGSIVHESLGTAGSVVTLSTTAEVAR
ncbi:MAG: NADH-quinone oxidoreductase subunit G [Propionibacterium sp.]|nr:NADH-quinone oxidoreductase subunit G [Propionibacterium sp.]